ncbi:Protein fem-1 homolog B, partial [Gryllus bimaculatus]
FECVKLLVEAGANVNHATKSNSTPLHVACYSGVLRTVEFLIQRGADIQVQENHGHSCLMAATYRGYLDVLLFLLDKGTDSNQSTVCGNTALHIAAECGNVNVMVLFLQFGAKPRRNAIGLSPLHLATKCSLAHMVEYLVTRPEFCKEEKVDALELLGASFANNPDFYNLPSAYKYMRLSMELRYPLKIRVCE